MKTGAKRRRTKAEMDELKEEQRLREQADRLKHEKLARAEAQAREAEARAQYNENAASFLRQMIQT